MSNFTVIQWPVSDWFLKLALYTAVDISANTSSAVKAILTSTATVDFYCPHCKKESTFQGVLSTETQNSIASEMMAAKSFGMASGFWTHTIFSKQLACSRAGHKAIFYFQIEDKQLYKVGQYPSIADINYGEALEYAPALGEARVREINKAIELAANNCGLGAVSYLKKIFDSLLADHEEQAKFNQASHAKFGTIKEWDIDAYLVLSYHQKLSKLGALGSAIPIFLLEHAETYAILDSNIQTLSEEECLANFEALKTAVLFLADQKVADAKYKARLQQADEILVPS